MKMLNAKKDWQEVTLVDDEIWQARGTVVTVDTDTDASTRFGIQMLPGQTIQFKAGTTVYYRRHDDGMGSINRMKV